MQVGNELFPSLVLSGWAGDLLKLLVILFEFYQISFNVSAESSAKKVDPESRVTSIERPFCFIMDVKVKSYFPKHPGCPPGQ